ncbi:MAG: PD-(D/E)XK nuclease family protein, partial [Paludibacter sp.]|nr:PD-(D/E)XK nuclease family protein [Paludibacter sp.]
YFNHHNTDISRFTFVFPNRRAGLFFQRYLSQIANRPIFSPEIITINECFASACTWQTADRLSMLFRLYNIYRKLSRNDESFDTFAFWGEMLLNDFDEVDKYMVDARQLFTNVTELKEIDRLFNVFSETQIAAIKEFWKNFIPVTEEKTQQEFITTWNILNPVYEECRRELIAENTATEGMISRNVASRLKNKENIPQWENKQFVFIGFNALNPCERALMAELQKREQADFYWDYEASELRDLDNPASQFYAQNTQLFPSKYTIEPVIESLNEKIMEIIAVPSAVGQAKQVFSILNKIYPPHEKNENLISTAVVLPDESLITPLLHSLPEQIAKVNVTMGFPLSTTPVASLIDSIFELQKRIRISGKKVSFYYITVANILNHQYIALLCSEEVHEISRQISENNLIYITENDLQKNDLLKAIFTHQTDAENFLPYLLRILRILQINLQRMQKAKNDFQLETDFIYQYYITLNRMSDIIKENSVKIEMNLDTLMRLTRQITSGITIPFVGEPLDGLQVMGVLETRGIDFENLIITSFNEGVYPKKSASDSFIPYNLRKGFGLPTNEFHDAILSYNFYRLIHHAKRIFFLYDSRTEGMQSGEVSRYLHQLYYHYGVEIKHKTVSYDISFNNVQNIQIEKTPDVMNKLYAFLSKDEDGRSLSASSIKTYIDCPLQFYLTQIEKTEQPDEVTEMIEDNMFGTLFHAVMENIYEPYLGKIIQPDDIKTLIDNQLFIDKQINKAFAKKFFKKKTAETVELEGNNLLIANVLQKYVKQVLRTDKDYAPFKYLNSEERCKISFPIEAGEVNLKGFIDRVDEKDERIRILDYKTGAGNLNFKSLSEVFEHNNHNKNKFVLQTFLYGIFYKEKAAGKIITPGIYFIRNVFNDGFSTTLNYKPDPKTNLAVEDFVQFEDEFNIGLRACLNEIFDPEIPFFQTTNTSPCEYCLFTGICSR